MGEVIKVKGGYKSMKFIKTTVDGKFSNRAASNTREKDDISKAAVNYIETGRSLFVDSGSTMVHFAKVIPNSRLTITTTGPNIAIELANKSNVIINLVGGMLNRENISLSGSQSVEYIKNINIDIAFIVPSGVSLESGFTSGNYSEFELKRIVTEKARKVIALFDHSKIDHTMPYTFCTFADVDVIITDAPLPEDMMKEAERNNIEVVVV